MPMTFDRPSMAAGEMAPSLWGRVDLAKYQVGMATMLNWFVHANGGASTRAGTSICGEVIDSTKRGRLIEFQFRDRPSGQNYVLEFGDAKMRVIMNGGYVLETAVNITGVTQANPGVLTVVGHGWTTGDTVYIDGIVGMLELNQREVTVTVVDANHVSIGVNTTAYTAWSSGGAAARVYTVAHPYALADLATLKYVQNADTMTFTHPSYAVQTLTRSAHTSWTWAAHSFSPNVAAPTGPTAGAGANTYVITAVNDETAEESLPSAPVVGGGTVHWTDVAGCSKYNVYRLTNGIYAFLGGSGGGAAGYTDTGTVAPDASDTPPQSRNPFGSANNYPSCAIYHDGRKFFGSTNNGPQTYWSSQSASETNFSVSAPVKDSDAITRTIKNRKVNIIKHMVSMTDLLVFTTGGEFKVYAGSNSDVLTPAACITKAQSYEGCNDMPPITTRANAVLFTSGSNKRVLEVSFNAISNVWEPRDMSILSDHLFENNTISEWAYCKHPYGVIWVVRDDGVMLGFTYLKEHDVYAWTRHTTDGTIESVAAIDEGNETYLYMLVNRTIGGVTKRYVERMASRVFADINHAWCLDSARQYDGWNTDTTKMLKINGATYNAGDSVTLSASGHTPFTAASVGKQYMLRNTANQSLVSITITAYTNASTVTATLDQAPHTSLQNVNVSDWALAITVMHGLWHIEGKTVSPLVDGNVHPDVVVTNGAVTFERPVGLALVGLSYTCDLESLTPVMQDAGGSIQGRPMSITHTTVRVKNSRGLAAGPSFTNLKDIKERRTENWGWPTAWRTGDESINLPASWSKKGHVCLRQKYPLPATVVGLFPNNTVGDNQ